MEETERVRCDRCGRRLVDGFPGGLLGTGSRTLCLGCAHPAYAGWEPTDAGTD